ncbi:MAG: triose-phosphate isomerase, partial [Porphyromonadaceae bacterium]|nr:triose-phosphate isomerase [Porphyromonadaceae bacterium]
MVNKAGQSRWIQRIRPKLVVIARIVIGLAFIFSGFVKGVDPVGTSLKVREYLLAFDFDSLLSLSFFLAICLSIYEFVLGVNALFGSYRRVTSVLLLLTMLVMTGITLYLVWVNPISDCGCFGEAVYLTNGQSLFKNIVLLLLSIFLLFPHRRVDGLYHKEIQPLTVQFSILFILGISIYGNYFQPLFDFRPYKSGMDIREQLTSASLDEPRYIYEKEGVRTMFAIDDLPTDTAWHFVERVSLAASKNSIHNFAIYDGDEEITDAILDVPGYTILVLSPSLATADNSTIDKIDELYDYAIEYGYPFYCLTASSPEEIAKWQDDTGADYPFYSMEASTIQSVVRGNPGVVLLHDGVIVEKSRPWRLPGEAELNAPLEELPLGQVRTYTVWRPLVTVLLIFFCPMLFLLLFSKTIEVYVVRARVRRVARLRKMHLALKEKIMKNKEETQLQLNHIIMRKKIVAGNWKMNKTLQEGLALAKGIESALTGKKVNCDVIIGVPFIHLASIAQTIDTRKIGVAAENCADKVSGAYTGEVSAAMVASTGAKYVILGHSERRAYYHETPEILKEKVSLALANGLTPIFCIGEVLAEREAGTHFDVVKAQIEGSLFHLSAEDFGKIILAYEPVWAIGT